MDKKEMFKACFDHRKQGFKHSCHPCLVTSFYSLFTAFEELSNKLDEIYASGTTKGTIKTVGFNIIVDHYGQELCVCGHTRSYHNGEGCYALQLPINLRCECSKFQLAGSDDSRLD